MSTVLRSVLKNNGQIQESEADIEIARQQLARARAGAFPRGEAIVLGAPLFEERGDPQHSVADWTKWGPYARVGGQLVQPLFTFGQLGGYKKAAEHQVIANSELAEVKRWEILVTAKDFYYSYLMAYELERLVGDLSSFLEEAVKTAEEEKDKGGKKGKEAVRPHDLYRLRTSLEDLNQKKLLATAGKKSAERAVLWISGSKFDSVPVRALEPEKFEKKTLEEYVALAKANRPEFKALAAGQIARNALADAKDAQSNPTLFIGAFLDASWTPTRNKQLSIFANDPFNRINAGAGIGIRFDLEYWRHAAEAAEERAQAMKLKATESYAAPGIELQVKRAFWDMEGAAEAVEIAKKRRDLGKKWFVSSAMGWSIGVTAAKDLMESLEGSGLARQNYIQTIYQYNLALAKLSQAVGREVTTDLKYRD